MSGTHHQRGSCPAKFRNVVGDVPLFDRDESGIHHRVQRKVLLPPAIQAAALY